MELVVRSGTPEAIALMSDHNPYWAAPSALNRIGTPMRVANPGTMYPGATRTESRNDLRVFGPMRVTRRGGFA
jgi:hypothetical protein